MPAPLSVIIPTLNATDALPGTCNALLEGVTDGLIGELILSDGGSSDGIREMARELGATLVTGPKGRGTQIARGVAAAQSPWLLILHADTHLSEGWTKAALHHMQHHADMAGWFHLKFRAPGFAPRSVAAGANLRSRLLGLPYGDQGLLISANLLGDVGGIPDLPLMEDVALARRLKSRLRPLGATAETSANRYLQDGWARRVARNLWTLARYLSGASPEDLARRYD